MGLWQTLAVVLATAILAWFGHTVVAVLQRQTEKDKALEAEKREVYKRLIVWVFDLLKAAKRSSGEVKLTAEIEKEFFGIVRDVTIYASDDVLRCFVQFKSNQLVTDPKHVLGLLAALLLSIRKDLGHTSTNIEPKEMLSAFITDIDSLELDDLPNLALQRTRPATARGGQS